MPTRIDSLNKGLSTLQFQSLSVDPSNSNVVQGGTQDNGTWQTTGNPVKWAETMIGDGGQSGFDVVNRQFRFHTFAGQQVDVNFSGGDTADWNWMSDPFFIAGSDPLPLSTCRSSPIRKRAARCSSASATSGGRQRTGSD